MSLFQILYIENDSSVASQILEDFNPPCGMSLEMIKKRNKELPEKDKYKYSFDFHSTFQEALKALIFRNLDPLGKEKGLQPFDTIFFEVRRKSKLDKYSWLDFLKTVHNIGLQRLALHNGFLAHGPEIDPSLREELAHLNVRYYLPKPFSEDKLRSALKEYLFYSYGSHYIKIEERDNEADLTQKRRVLRFYDADGKLEAIELPPVPANRVS